MPVKEPQPVGRVHQAPQIVPLKHVPGSLHGAQTLTGQHVLQYRKKNDQVKMLAGEDPVDFISVGFLKVYIQTKQPAAFKGDDEAFLFDIHCSNVGALLGQCDS